MKNVQIAARINKAIKDALDAVCEARGLKMNRFLEEAILDKLEELEDIEDIKAIRHETTRPFRQVLAELKLDGKI